MTLAGDDEGPLGFGVAKRVSTYRHEFFRAPTGKPIQKVTEVIEITTTVIGHAGRVRVRRPFRPSELAWQVPGGMLGVPPVRLMGNLRIGAAKIGEHNGRDAYLDLNTGEIYTQQQRTLSEVVEEA